MATLPDEFHFGGVPDGWRDLVARMLLDMRYEDPLLDVMEAREEFGRLFTIWFSSADEDRWMRISAIAKAAEDASERTCSVCGAPGTMRMPRELPVCDACFGGGT